MSKIIFCGRGVGDSGDGRSKAAALVVAGGWL